MELGTSHVDLTPLSGSEEVGNEDIYVDMVNDAFRDNVRSDNYHQDGNYQDGPGNYQNVVDDVCNSKKFYDLLEGAKIPCMMVVVKVTRSYP